jgi:hypothetical protein
VRRLAIAVLISFGLGPSAALAWDWSLKTSESETVELNSNQFLRTNPAASVGSYTTLTANAEALTPTSKFNFDANGSYKKYWGPGVAGTVSEFLHYDLHARYEQDGKNKFDREFIETNWSQQDTSLAILNDLGVLVPAAGFLDRLTATGGIDRSVSARDAISLLTTSTRTSYEPFSAGTPFTDTLAHGNWRHLFNSTTAGSFSSEAELLDYDNAFGTQVGIYRNQIGIDTTLSPLLSFRANAGAALVATDRGVSSSPLHGGLSVSPTSSSVIEWIGDAVLTYKFSKTATLSVVASQSIGPSIVGSLVKRDTITANVNYIINSRENLTFSAGGNRQIAGTTTDYGLASVTYGYAPVRDLSLQLTYRYQHRFQSVGTTIVDPLTNTPTVSGLSPADSHALLFTATHNFVALPHGY